MKTLKYTFKFCPVVGISSLDDEQKNSGNLLINKHSTVMLSFKIVHIICHSSMRRIGVINFIISFANSYKLSDCIISKEAVSENMNLLSRPTSTASTKSRYQTTVLWLQINSYLISQKFENLALIR